MAAIAQRPPQALDPKRGLSLRAPRAPLKGVAEFCLFEVAFFFAYRYGMSFSQTCASPFWFPDSVLLCALLLVRPRRWWIFVLGPLPIRLFASGPDSIPGWFLLTTFAIDSAKGVIAAGLLRRFSTNPTRLETLREFGLFCLVAVSLVPALSAFAGAAALHARGADYWTAWQQWFMGDALAHLVVTPAILYWIFAAPWKAWTTRMPSTKRWVEGGVLALGLLVTGYTAFSTGRGEAAIAEARFFAPVPFIFWAAVRFGMFGASGAIMVMAFFSVEAALAERGPFSGQSPAGTAAALQYFLLWRAAPLYLVAILVEQSRASARSLRESEERFRNMANTASVMIWMSGPDKLCQFVNKGWLAFTGRALESELGRGWTEDIHPDDLRHCLEIYNSAFDSRQPFEMEFHARRHDGEYRWILNRGLPRFDTNGEFLGYISSAIDITERKRVAEAQQNLAHVARLAVAGELTGMIAHEVNQPLCAIVAEAAAGELLLKSTHPPLDELRDILASIHREGHRAGDTIKKVRALLGGRQIETQPLSINDVIVDVLALVKADALRRRVRLGAQLAPALPLVVGDRVQLQQVLLNLVVNGMDALEVGPAERREILLKTAQNDGAGIRVSVTDSGPGIPAERLASLFDAFFTTKKDGMGLGLAIARTIIEAHRGRIWAESNGQGAIFTFDIPADATLEK